MATTIKESFDLDERPIFVQLASDKYQKIWEQCSNAQKTLLESQATLRELDTPEKVNRFFETRDFGIIKSSSFVVARPQLKSLNESHDPIVNAMKTLV